MRTAVALVVFLVASNTLAATVTVPNDGYFYSLGVPRSDGFPGLELQPWTSVVNRTFVIEPNQFFRLFDQTETHIHNGNLVYSTMTFNGPYISVAIASDAEITPLEVLNVASGERNVRITRNGSSNTQKTLAGYILALPEPSSAILLLVSSIPLLRRRR